MTADNTARLAQIRDRNRYLAQIPYDAHEHPAPGGCIPCELVRAVDDVTWLLAERDAMIELNRSYAKHAQDAVTQATAAESELTETRALAAGLRQQWGVQAEHSQSAFPARTQELAEQIAAMYSRVREPGCPPTPHHVVTRYESDWRRLDAEQQPEGGDHG